MNFEKYKEKAFAAFPELHREYEDLEPDYRIIQQIIKFRMDANLTQKEFAERVGMKQSNISRLERGNANPSLNFLKKLAKGMGKELIVDFCLPGTQEIPEKIENDRQKAPERSSERRHIARPSRRKSRKKEVSPQGVAAFSQQSQ